MKKVFCFLFILFLSFSSEGKEAQFTGSTPAGPVVKTFLGIPLRDSIDFIRWVLVLKDDQYQLTCSYGIGKPNTNGFMNGGKKIELKGSLNRDGNSLNLQNAGTSLGIAQINDDLLHLLDPGKQLLVGNGGWSYTLCSMKPLHTAKINLKAKSTDYKDSIAFQGRTPCGIPGIVPADKTCYKLKWYIVLYPNKQGSSRGKYKVIGTPYRLEGGKTGAWTIIQKDGRIIYQLEDLQGKGFIYLLKLDENILVFTDADGKLLVGNEDFSYTMNAIK